MTLTDVFKTNCRATASLINQKPSLSFKDLVSGIGGKNKNGTIARFSFDNFFIDLYFIENGPLAYAPNTIWISVGFEPVPFLPFSVYDILAVADRENFKCYTYSYLYTNDVMIQAFGEINDLFKTFIPKMEEISETGTLKNNLIESQKEAINKFVNDDIFKREIEMLDASLKIREMLIRNFVEAVISRVILGGLSDFYNGNHEKALKMLSKSKHLTFYETRLLKKLENGELKDYDASPYRDEKYKSLTKEAKKSAFFLSPGTITKVFVKSLLLTPVFLIILLFIHFLLCHLSYNDAILYLNADIVSIASLLIAAFSVAETIFLHFPHKIKNSLVKKNKNEFSPPRKLGILKYITIFTEVIVIVLIMSSVNNAVVFTENKVYFPENKYISLKQESVRYEHFETVYKAKGYYHLDLKYYELEHYILVTKNGEIIDLSLYPGNYTEEFEKNILPIFISNGCEIKEIESERDIK